MKFGVIGSVSKPTTYQSTGGVEVWTALFLLNSIIKGHKFDLYALKDSINIQNKIKLIEISSSGVDKIKTSDNFIKKHLSERNLNALFEIYFSRALLMLKKNEHKYDIIINSSGSPSIPINWDLFSKPMLTIMHFNASEPNVSFFDYFPIPSNTYFIFSTIKQYTLASQIPPNQKFYIPWGIDTQRIPFEKSGENLLWFGRIDPTMNKGVEEAIKISNKMKLPLDIFTYIENPIFFEKQIKPFLSKYSNLHLGLEREKYFKNAKLFILPLVWEEPFGLTILEAMTSGVPVIAYARGSVPEVVKDGETGFIVNPSESDKRGDFIIKETGIIGLSEAIKRVYSLSEKEYFRMRQNCRTHIEKNFTVQKMIERFEKVYEAILSERDNNLRKTFSKKPSIHKETYNRYP